MRSQARNAFKGSQEMEGAETRFLGERGQGVVPIHRLFDNAHGARDASFGARRRAFGIRCETGGELHGSRCELDSQFLPCDPDAAGESSAGLSEKWREIAN